MPSSYDYLLKFISAAMKVDIESEIRSLLPGAEQGELFSMLNLAFAYSKIGNWAECYFWGSLAEQFEGRKNEPASDVFGGPHLSPEQKAAVEKRVREWQPKPVSETTKEALADLQRRAGDGDSQAQFDLGTLYTLGHHYWSGWGLKRDFGEARTWWIKAAAQGHVDAQFELGEAFSKGLGVKPDYIEAMKWYKMAAAQGHVEAQKNIDLLRAHGHGTSRK